MSTTSNDHISSDPPVDKLDNLAEIKGIGPIRQRWLRETFQIRTYHDLTLLSAEEIESQLQAEGRAAPRKEINAWIDQARELADATTTELSKQAGAFTTTIAAKAVNVMPEFEKDWRPIASFAVEFQENIGKDANNQMDKHRTSVHHMETDTDAMWAGIENEKLCRWMVDQLGQGSGSSNTHISGNDAATKPMTATQVYIQEVRLYQPAQANTPMAIGKTDQPFQAEIKSSQPATLEAIFYLPEIAGAADIKLVTYTAQFTLRPLGTRPTDFVIGETATVNLKAGSPTQMARLPDANLQPGIYRLRVQVTLNTMPPSIGALTLPLFKVI